MSPKEVDAVKRARVQIDVADTGIGIQARKLPLLFRKFSQLDSSTTRYFQFALIHSEICAYLTGQYLRWIWLGSRYRTRTISSHGRRFMGRFSYVLLLLNVLSC